MLAVVRPTSWDPILFLHVLGASILFGALATVTLLAVVGQRRPEHPRLARAALWTLVGVAAPGWLLMYIAGYATKSKEHLGNHIHWIQVPEAIIHAGLLLLLAAIGIAFSWSRRPAGGWQTRSLVVVSSSFIVALAIAWWVMTAKPGL